MKSFLERWHLLLLILAGWINQRQQNAIEYLRTENQILKRKLGKNASGSTMISGVVWQLKARSSARKILQEVATIVSPGTILP
jgi:hypothetical protein